ncbi:hypothetical protein Gotri_022610 [Gossypium trilobum]|uniref:Uncharacterized protein n=1 Tax=Gossypium trilobum TaxID=34281 RepID=A0A7J9DGD4_9ROSI|nr:hypothetical protein [Gossypium trilobum]
MKLEISKMIKMKNLCGY